MGCRRQSGRGLVQLELHGSRLLFARLEQRQPVEVTRKRRLARVGGAKIKRKGLVPGKEGEEEKKKRQTRHRNSRSLCDLFSTTLLSSPLSLSLISSTLSLCLPEPSPRFVSSLFPAVCRAHWASNFSF